MCSSEFILDEWRSNLTAGLVANLSIYTQRDYRRFLSAHLQFLQGLCRLSMQSVNSSIQQLLSSLFITAQLLSAEDFDLRFSSLINQSKSNAPITFNRLLSLTRIVNHGNAIISSYGTNFDYIPYFYQEIDTYAAATRAVIYDDDCSCGLLPNCTTQANFIEENVLKLVAVKGMKMGCTPSESFRLSTLECFYDQSCLDLIQHYTNYSTPILPLGRTMKRFRLNTTVNELINDGFVEEWKTSMNYSSYFHKCSPSLCSYIYVQQFNLLYIITLFLGLHGGVSIVLKWICPQIVQLILKIYQHRKRRITPVPPIHTLEATSAETVNVDVHNRISRMKSISSADEVLGYVFLSVYLIDNFRDLFIRDNNVSPIPCSSKCAFIYTFVVFLIIVMVIFSTYITLHGRKQEISTGMIVL